MSAGLVHSAKVFRRLHAAMDDRRRVRIARSLEGADTVDGYVVAIGDDWFLLKSTTRRFSFDGWDALRVRDVATIKRYPKQGNPDAGERVLQAKDAWPPDVPMSCDLSSIESIVSMSKTLGEILEIHREKKDPWNFWVGHVRKVSDSRLDFEKLNDSAEWAGSRSFSLKSITRFAFGNSYLEGLNLIAPPLPTS